MKMNPILSLIHLFTFPLSKETCTQFNWHKGVHTFVSHTFALALSFIAEKEVKANAKDSFIQPHAPSDLKAVSPGLTLLMYCNRCFWGWLSPPNFELLAQISLYCNSTR